MDQLILDILPRSVPTFENFAIARNYEAVAALRALAGGTPGERFVYLWGDAGCGKSHLLQACVDLAGPRARYLACSADTGKFTDVAKAEIIALDDVDQLTDGGQVQLFHLYNRLRESGRALVTSGDAAPQELALRPELASRLAWGLVFRLEPLTDEEKLAALSQHALERGCRIPQEVLNYLLSHHDRSLSTLMLLLERLDAYSLATRRPITIALIKELVNRSD